MNKTNREIRYHNARLLQEACGGQSVMVDLLGKSQSQVSSFLGDNPSKGSGPKIARQIEDIFSLDHGWLDIWHDEAPQLQKDGNNFKSIFFYTSAADISPKPDGYYDLVINSEDENERFTFLINVKHQGAKEKRSQLTDDFYTELLTNTLLKMDSSYRKPKIGDKEAMLLYYAIMSTKASLDRHKDVFGEEYDFKELLQMGIIEFQKMLDKGIDPATELSESIAKKSPKKAASA